MIKEKCPGCDAETDMNMCGQPFELDGKIRFFHIGCFEGWYDRDIDVMRVTKDGSSYVTREPVTMEGVEEGSITWTKMKQGKFWTLREFQGF